MPVLAPRHAIAAVYVGLFFGIGVYMPFFPVWLQARGFDASWIAFALAVPMAARLVTMPLGGLIADRSGRPRATLMLYALATALCFAGVALAPGTATMLIALALATCFWQPSLPVIDAYAVSRRKLGQLDYGRVRLWGSLSFIGGNMAGGLLLGLLPGDAVVWFIVAGALVTAGASALLEEAPLAPRGARPAKASVTAILAVGIAAAALVQGSHGVLYAFASVHWRALGYSDAVIGLLWAVGVLAEVLLFRVGTRITARLGPERLLMLGGLAGVLRFGAMALEPPLAVLAGLQMLHGLTFGCTYLGTVELVARHAPAGRQAGTQALASWATAIVMTGTILLSGPLWTLFGAGAFYTSALMALAGAGLAFAAWMRPQPQSAASGG